MKKFKGLFQLIGAVLIILFLVVYIAQATGYYELTENRKTALTDEAIGRFEEDVKNGKKIIASNYLVKEKNYNNNISVGGMRLSSAIEKGFNKFMGLIFKELEKVVND